MIIGPPPKFHGTRDILPAASTRCPPGPCRAPRSRTAGRARPTRTPGCPPGGVRGAGVGSVPAFGWSVRRGPPQRPAHASGSSAWAAAPRRREIPREPRPALAGPAGRPGRARAHWWRCWLCPLQHAPGDGRGSAVFENSPRHRCLGWVNRTGRVVALPGKGAAHTRRSGTSRHGRRGVRTGRPCRRLDGDRVHEGLRRRAGR